MHDEIQRRSGSVRYSLRVRMGCNGCDDMSLSNSELIALLEAIGSLRDEQRVTNNLLRELIQSNAALIEALGEPEQVIEQERDLDGNRRVVADRQSVYMDAL